MSYCLQPKCGALVERGYCRDHQRQGSAWKGTAHSRGYTSRWRQRADDFRRRYRLCGMRPDGQAPVMSRCHDEGRATRASCVDHVVPHRNDARLFWDEHGNWQAMCDACHARKTASGR